jgi:DNA polymerase elongation subunit (family B)
MICVSSFFNMSHPLNSTIMEEIEKNLKSFTWTEESIIRIFLNSNGKAMLKELMPIFRKYTNAIVINYNQNQESVAMVCIGQNTFSIAS